MAQSKNKITDLDQQLKRDAKRLTEIYKEITEIMERVHILSLELGATKAFIQRHDDKKKEAENDG